MSSPSSPLDRLISPRRIAVVGASATPGKVGFSVMDALSHAEVPVVPVHPRASEIRHRAVVHNISDLPDDTDLAIIATGADIAVSAAEECAQNGIPFVVVLASGFSEVGPEGEAREAELKRIASTSNTRILGPNTLGFQIPHSGVDTIFVDHAAEEVAGGATVLVSQSGSVAVEALLAAVRYGFGIRAFFGLGNKADLAELDFLNQFADDDEVSCIALYMEDLSAGRPFLNRVRQVAARKPVVVIKAGRTEAGATAASSHTGRLSGSDRVIDGALAQHLFQRVEDDEELCDVSKALELCAVPAGNRVAILSPAGGYGVMLSDAVDTPSDRVELTMATLSETTASALRDVLPGFASVHNPVDLTASVVDASYAAALKAVLDDGGVDIVVLVFFLAPPGITSDLTEMLAGIVRDSTKPVIVLAGDEDGTGQVLRSFHDAGIAAYPSVSRTATALRALERRRRILKLAESELRTDPAHDPASQSIPARVARPASPLHEKAAKEFLTQYGVPFPESVLVPTGAGIDNLDLPAGPYAVKVCSVDVQHKTEAGGVVLNIGETGLAEALQAMQKRFPNSDVLVEQMVRHSGIEFILGAFRDPELGPCIMVGAGGISAEVVQDVAFRLLPATRIDAREMLDELTVSPLLEGFRGLPSVRAEVEDLVFAVSRAVVDLGDSFSELDLNPLVITADGLVALDAALILHE